MLHMRVLSQLLCAPSSGQFYVVQRAQRAWQRSLTTHLKCNACSVCSYFCGSSGTTARVLLFPMVWHAPRPETAPSSPRWHDVPELPQATSCTHRHGCTGACTQCHGAERLCSSVAAYWPSMLRASARRGTLSRRAISILSRITPQTCNNRTTRRKKPHRSPSQKNE